MTEHTIYEILAKKFSGGSSVEEDKILEEWLQENDENRESYQRLRQVWEQEETNDQKYKVINQDHQREKIWNEGFGKKQDKPAILRAPLLFLKIAASVLIFLGAGWMARGLVMGHKQALKQPQTIVKENPKGQKSKIFLPDGSTVWLNSASKLSFHRGFSDSLRLISLTGEAYFEVATDVNRPFVVETHGVHITALGTSFNVNTRQHGLLGVSLVEGKVQVSGNASGEKIILKPGEYSTFDNDGKLFKKGHFDRELTLSWKDGILYFKNASLTEITRELEQWYGVEIDNQISPDDSKHFNGRFDNENLENVLRNISFALEFDYKINGNKVTIRKNTK